MGCTEPWKAALGGRRPACGGGELVLGAALQGSLWALPGGPPGLRAPLSSSPGARTVCPESS